jgi:hypothetical protein
MTPFRMLKLDPNRASLSMLWYLFDAALVHGGIVVEKNYTDTCCIPSSYVFPLSVSFQMLRIHLYLRVTLTKMINGTQPWNLP